MTHDRAQALSQIWRKPGARPMLRNVVTADTTNVIKTDSSNGMTNDA